MNAFPAKGWGTRFKKVIREMIISDEIIFHVLLILKKESPVDNSHFINAILVTELKNTNISPNDFIAKATQLKFIQYHENDRTITITKEGLQFIKKYSCKLKRDEFNKWALFIKNIFWIISYITLILLNIFQFLKIMKVF